MRTGAGVLSYVSAVGRDGCAAEDGRAAKLLRGSVLYHAGHHVSGAVSDDGGKSNDDSQQAAAQYGLHGVRHRDGGVRGGGFYLPPDAPDSAVGAAGIDFLL